MLTCLTQGTLKTHFVGKDRLESFKCQMLMAAVWTGDMTEEFSFDVVKSSVIALHAPVALGNKQFVLLCDLEQIDTDAVCSAVRLCASKQCVLLCLHANEQCVLLCD